MNDLFNKLKADPGLIERVLFPGRQISDFNADDLKIACMDSGFESLNKKFVLKQNRGEFIVIGARPSHGKSAMLFQMAYNVAKSGKSHVFSLEMDHASVVTRQIAGSINLPIDAVVLGLRPDQIQHAKTELKKLDMVIDDEGGLSVEEICYRARQENKRSPTAAIFVDYIQIIPGMDHKKEYSRANEVAKISGALRALGKELKVPVIVASQLNRNNEMREDKTPQLSDLKESGAIEQDADVVILLYRDYRKAPGEAKVIVAKNRNGPTGEISMNYAPAQTRFIDGVTDEGI